MRSPWTRQEGPLRGGQDHDKLAAILFFASLFSFHFSFSERSMRLAPVSAWSLRALVVGIVLTLSACNATLAPGYDPELVSDLNAANEQALILFSEVSQGASTARYAALAPTYDALIGKFDALRL